MDWLVQEDRLDQEDQAALKDLVVPTDRRDHRVPLHLLQVTRRPSSDQ